MRMDRKNFFKVIGASALAAHLGGCGGTSPDGKTAGDVPVRKREPVITTGPKMAVVTGVDPDAITRRAIEEMGGMEVFVSRGDKVLIKRVEAESKTAGGIVLPESAKEKPKRGIVQALGDDRLLDSGERSKLQVAKGDEVLFSSYAGTEIKVNGQELLILDESDILAIIG